VCLCVFNVPSNEQCELNIFSRKSDEDGQQAPNKVGSKNNNNMLPTQALIEDKHTDIDTYIDTARTVAKTNDGRRTHTDVSIRKKNRYDGPLAAPTHTHPGTPLQALLCVSVKAMRPILCLFLPHLLFSCRAGQKPCTGTQKQNAPQTHIKETPF